jgi:hypothetical protein
MIAIIGDIVHGPRTGGVSQAAEKHPNTVILRSQQATKNL